MSVRNKSGWLGVLKRGGAELNTYLIRKLLALLILPLVFYAQWTHADDPLDIIEIHGSACQLINKNNERAFSVCDSVGAEINIQADAIVTVSLPSFTDAPRREYILEVRSDGLQESLSLVDRLSQGLILCEADESCSQHGLTIAQHTLDYCESDAKLAKVSSVSRIGGKVQPFRGVGNVAICHSGNEYLLIFDYKLLPYFGRTVEATGKRKFLDVLIFAEFDGSK